MLKICVYLMVRKKAKKPKQPKPHKKATSQNLTVPPFIKILYPCSWTDLFIHVPVEEGKVV